MQYTVYSLKSLLYC